MFKFWDWILNKLGFARGGPAKDVSEQLRELTKREGPNSVLAELTPPGLTSPQTPGLSQQEVNFLRRVEPGLLNQARISAPRLPDGLPVVITPKPHLAVFDASPSFPPDPVDTSPFSDSLDYEGIADGIHFFTYRGLS